MKALYYLTLYIFAVGCAFAFFTQDITARFAISTIIVYFWQLSVYHRLKGQKIRFLDVALCLLLDLPAICMAVYFRYFSMKFLLSGSLFFPVLLIGNNFIIRWWNSIKQSRKLKNIVNANVCRSPLHDCRRFYKLSDQKYQEKVRPQLSVNGNQKLPL